jgi:hypothetical protein
MSFGRGDKVVSINGDFGIGTVLEIRSAPPVTMYLVQWPMPHSMPQQLSMPADSIRLATDEALGR